MSIEKLTNLRRNEFDEEQINMIQDFIKDFNEDDLKVINDLLELDRLKIKN